MSPYPHARLHESHERIRHLATTSLYEVDEIFRPAGKAGKKKGPGGQRNPLKRFKTAKEIQENSSLFLIDLARAWLDLAGFG
jgi:hypothetical protein